MNGVSVIIPVYNHATELSCLLNSLEKQIMKPQEIIAVDDGSEDNIQEAIAPFRDKIIFLEQENRGASSARNKGACLARGDFLIFVDADLVPRNDMISRMRKVLDENRDAAFAYSSFYYGFKKFPCFEFDLEKLKSTPYIHTTSMIRRQWFFGFDESLKRFQDWDLFLTIALKGGKGCFIDEYLFKVKPRKSGISRWFPGFFLKTLFLKKLETVRNYNEARDAVLLKHGLK